MTFDQVYEKALCDFVIDGKRVPVYQSTVPDDANGAGPGYYIIFNEAQCDYIADAANRPRRARHLVQVHAVGVDGSRVRKLMRDIRRNLTLWGVKPMYSAALIHEEDTGLYHLPLYTHYFEMLTNSD